MEMLKCRSWDKLKVVVLGWQVLESVWFVWILNSFVVMNLPDGPSTKGSANFLAGSCAYFLLGLRLPAQRLFSLCFLFAPTDLKSIDQWLIGLVCKHALTYMIYMIYVAFACFRHILLPLTFGWTNLPTKWQSSLWHGQHVQSCAPVRGSVRRTLFNFATTGRSCRGGDWPAEMSQMGGDMWRLVFLE